MKDILLATNFDLLFASGDFAFGESTRQHQQILLIVEKGELKEFPTNGVGTHSWLNDDTAGDYNAEVKKEFERDGMKVLKVKGTLPLLEIEAVYA
jgi:hypothetical protein